LGKPGYWILASALGWPWLEMVPFQQPSLLGIYLGQTRLLDFGQCPWLALAGDGPIPITQFARHLHLQTGLLDFGQSPWLALAGNSPILTTQLARHLPWQTGLLDFGQCPWLALAGDGPTPITQFAAHLPWANWVIGLRPMPLAGHGWK